MEEQLEFTPATFVVKLVVTHPLGEEIEPDDILNILEEGSNEHVEIKFGEASKIDHENYAMIATPPGNGTAQYVPFRPSTRLYNVYKHRREVFAKRVNHEQAEELLLKLVHETLEQLIDDTPLSHLYNDIAGRAHELVVGKQPLV